MGMHKQRNVAIRFNGITDGIVVPTGLYKESGVNLLRPDYSQNTVSKLSHATKIGRLHLASETNNLNRIMGPFTVEAFVIPDLGGVVVSKDGCFSLSIGDTHATNQIGMNTNIVFKIHCVGKTFTCSSNYNSNLSRNQIQNTFYANFFQFPHDFNLMEQKIYYLCAQFTGDMMKIFVNGNLVSKLNLVEQRVLDNVSSDLYIGGKGGEFRGIIDSVRISNGVVEPIIQPFTNQDSTIGLWDFNDDIDVPNIHFFNNRNEVNPTQGKEMTDSFSSEIDTPLVMLCYDFHNVNDMGYFRIHDAPDDGGVKDTYTALEKLASYATGIELSKIREQDFHKTVLNLNAYTNNDSRGVLNYIETNQVKHSSLNAVVNQSGTHPLTGMNITSGGLLIQTRNLQTVASSIIESLDPMINPIERIRILHLDFINDRVGCQSVILANDTTTSATIENHPKGQGFLFDHADGTPVWLTLGNADLTIDNGNPNTSAAVANQVTRAKDAFTKAQFTQSQKFRDKSGSGNTAYFISSQSRINATLGQPANTQDVPEVEPPFATNLRMYIAAGALNGVSDGATVTHIPDSSGNKFGVYSMGGTWQYQSASASFNGQPSVKLTSATGGWANIDTNDGESEAFQTTIGAGHTFAFMIKSNFDPSSVVSLFASSYSSGSPAGIWEAAITTANTFSLSKGVTVSNVPNISGNTLVNTPGLLIATFDDASGHFKVKWHGITSGNGLFSYSGLQPNFNGDRMGLLGRVSSTDQAAKTAVSGGYLATQNTEFAELVYYDRLLNEQTEIPQLVGYFYDKYGVI